MADPPPTPKPIVLVGGASSRFGRDKLLEPVGGGALLVDRAICALREAFAAKVTLVGNCDEAVRERGDKWLPDRFPGAGPLGGIAAALLEFDADVFVLSGDLPHIDAATVRLIVDGVPSASDASHPLVGVARTSRGIEPCIGLHRIGALETYLERLHAGKRSLHDALPHERVVLVDIPDECATNVNRPRDLMD